MNLSETKFDIIETEETHGVTTDINVWLKQETYATQPHEQDIRKYFSNIIECSGIKYFQLNPTGVLNGNTVIAGTIRSEITNCSNKEIKSIVYEALSKFKTIYSITYMPRIFSQTLDPATYLPSKDVHLLNSYITIRGHSDDMQSKNY